ncbi:acid-sensing ion channel 1A-like [Ptychodera flava]|uniref:acid-sensing ion channel 1A-like n=1 Tax=Ptychodera flava TaxID=63121 RepID=UPI00396A5D83
MSTFGLNRTSVVPLNNFAYETEFSEDRRTDEKPISTDKDDHNSEKDGKTWTGVFKTFTQEAGVSGVKFVGSANVSFGRRVFWLLIVLFALGGLLFQVSTLIMSFIDRPINVNIKFEEPKERPDFPAITICNNNMFRYNNVKNLLGGASIFLFYFPYLYAIFSSNGEAISEFDDFRVPEEAHYGEGQTQLTFMEETAHHVEDIVRRCSFGGLPCGTENFTKVITNYGICYTFNSNEQGYVNKVRNAGQQYGLQLLLFVNQREYVAPRTNVGFRLMVHGQDEIPNVASYGLSISPGTASTIGLTSKLVSNLGSPYGNCVENVENNLKYFDGAYSLSKCWMECETDYAVEQCGCRYFYMPGNSTYCSPYELQNCYFSAMDDFALKVDPCNHCEEPCVQTKYETKLSYDSYPSSTYSYLLTATGRWPCNEALAFYGIIHSSNDLMEITANMKNFVLEHYYTVEANGQNISAFISSPEFHAVIVKALTEGLFIDILNDLTFEVLKYTLTLIYKNGTDDVGSDFYAETKETLQQKYMNLSVNPWTGHNTTMWNMFASANHTTDSIQYLIDSLFQDYYLPLFDETFLYLYSELKSFRDNKTDEFVNEGPGDICKAYMQENFSKVTVYFEDLNVNSIIQQPGYHSFNLICDIGGSLGLFFGASIVTFVEIIDFFIVQFWLMKISGNK